VVGPTTSVGKLVATSAGMPLPPRTYPVRRGGSGQRNGVDDAGGRLTLGCVRRALLQRGTNGLREHAVSGRRIVPPGTTRTDAGTQVSTYWSATGADSCASRPEGADPICVNDLVRQQTAGTRRQIWPDAALRFCPAVVDTSNAGTRTQLSATVNH